MDIHIQRKSDGYRITSGDRIVTIVPTLPEATRTREAIVTAHNMSIVDNPRKGDRIARIGLTLTTLLAE